jgi:SNF2 family DNA or RNA helicase
MLLMARCGHATCKRCQSTREQDDRETDQCPHKQCGSVTVSSFAIEGSDMRATLPTELSKRHGSKMNDVVELLSRKSETEKVLVFVQFQRVAKALKDILKECKIDFLDLTGKPKDAPSGKDELARFRQGWKCNICLFEVDSPNAAGW